MITGIRGKLVRLTETAAELQVGPLTYEVFVPEFVRRQLQPLGEKEVSLRTVEYLEGNPQQGRLTPRLIGFLSDVEREFFDLICSVDGVGVKKALRAMVKPVREVATAIEEQDVRWLSTLPGIGPAVAERIVAKLRRKMPRFALLVERELPPESATDRSVLDEAFDALVKLGHSPAEARSKIDSVAGRKFKSVDELLLAIYQRERH